MPWRSTWRNVMKKSKSTFVARMATLATLRHRLGVQPAGKSVACARRNMWCRREAAAQAVALLLSGEDIICRNLKMSKISARPCVEKCGGGMKTWREIAQKLCGERSMIFWREAEMPRAAAARSIWPRANGELGEHSLFESPHRAYEAMSPSIVSLPCCFMREHHPERGSSKLRDR